MFRSFMIGCRFQPQTAAALPSISCPVAICVLFSADIQGGPQTPLAKRSERLIAESRISTALIG
jgi:hypothetical protein